MSREPGVKVPLGAHNAIHMEGRYDGGEVVCSCGWKTSWLYPAAMMESYAKRDAAERLANHVRHMTLVHDRQTHADTNCGHLCIYSRVSGGGS